MDPLRKEELVNALLTFMKEEIEKQGALIEAISFDFTPAYTQEYYNQAPKNFPDGEELQSFKQKESFTDEEFRIVFKYCLSNEYIQYSCLGSGEIVRLSEAGFSKVKELENGIILKNKIQKELIYIGTYKSADRKVNDLLIEAKLAFLEDNIQLAVEKIWDVLERVKTLTNKDKRQGIMDICNKLGDEISYDFFSVEYDALTKIGNDYQIRHFETNKKPINNKETQKYLFFRALSLINLTLHKIKGY